MQPTSVNIIPMGIRKSRLMLLSSVRGARAAQ
jgi:hypothetical protein